MQKDASYTRERLDRTSRKLEETSVRVTNLSNELDNKLPMTEGRKIYDMFKKYAMYKDLKELYKKCIPAIGQFEDKLSEYYTEQEKMKLILERFDEILNNKANKESITILKSFVQDEFARKDANDRFVLEQSTKMDEITSKTSTLEELVRFQAR
jgi:hypothetical protein